MSPVVWMQVIDIGHTAVMLPLAGAMAAWLALHQAWKLAVWWCVVFGCGLVLVAASKIAFLGWGIDFPPLRFQALSGHAWRTTAVVPVLAFLVLRQAPRGWRHAGVMLGFAFAIGLGMLLVIFGLHTASEVLASVILGAAAATIFMRQARAAPPWRPDRRAIPLALAVLVAIGVLKPASLNPRLVDVALYLSGRDDPYRWRPIRTLQRPAQDRIVTECRVRQPQRAHR